MKNFRKGRRFLLLGLCIVCVLFGVRFLCAEPFSREARGEEGQECRVYYLLNVDGMKGLGHAALMLVDEQGRGRLFSYNGMEYNLFWCLLGKEGLGKMKEFALDETAVERLLQRGDLPAGEYEECSNFDRALWRNITREDYEKILEGTRPYLETDREDTPLYQIYTHNCDTAARELIGLADAEVNRYNSGRSRLTPAGNYKEMCRKLGTAWGVIFLGRDTVWERAADALIF